MIENRQFTTARLFAITKRHFCSVGGRRSPGDGHGTIFIRQLDGRERARGNSRVSRYAARARQMGNSLPLARSTT